MTNQEAIEIINIMRKCFGASQDECNYDCDNCSLDVNFDNTMTALQCAIKCIERNEQICSDCKHFSIVSDGCFCEERMMQVYGDMRCDDWSDNE